GYPLESLQIEPEGGKYISEMTSEEQDAFWQRIVGKELCLFVRGLPASSPPPGGFSPDFYPHLARLWRETRR
ncbi:MAG: hypothetical protein ACJ8CR_13285, partial [Roseiflexaceae bacterium]